MKLFLKYSKLFAPYVCLGLFIKILGSLSELVIPFILEHIIDVVVPTSDMRAVLFWGVAMIVASLLTLVLNVVANRMAAKVARNVTEGVRHDLFRRVMYLTAAQIDKLTVPSLESRLTSDTFQIHRVTGMILRMGIRAPILLIGGVLVTLALDPVMTLVMLGTLPLIAVSVLIIVAGLKILNETKNALLGEAPVEETVDAIKKVVARYPAVIGIHDLMVHNYGPKNFIASLHAEVDGKDDIYELHDMIDNVERRIKNDFGISCTIHMDPIVTSDEEVNALKRFLENVLHEIGYDFSIHDFRVVIGATHTNLIFDIVVPFEFPISNTAIEEIISNAVKHKNENYYCVITIDRG